MRVLYLNHVSSMGGAEHSLLELLKRVPRDEVEPVVALPEGGPLASHLRSISIEIVTASLVRLKLRLGLLRAFKTGLRILGARRKLSRFVEAREIDLLHANSVSSHFVAGPVGKSQGRPVVWHVRDLRPIPIARGMLGQTATRIIAISQAVRRSLLDQGFPEDKIVVLYNGVDTARFHPGRSGGTERGRLNVPSGSFVFGMIAQMVPWKRHDLFLAAASEIAVRYPHARFWIVGDDVFADHPDYVASLRAQSSSPALSGKVSFLGYREDIEAVIAGLEALVLPSDAEPFGRVLIEAMAMGKPVIATRAGGPPEILEEGHHGYLTNPGDRNELYQAMARMIEEPERSHNMGTAARRHVEDCFSIDRHVAATVSLYRELVEQGR
ncbi:MAG: glycosyltransferase family 4 protein [Armatimonadetes bacterium]|nr:glycosyltransferase family 4 protein [Armatimonadota bacterium]